MNRYLPDGKLNPDMPNQTLRLMMGELSANEILVARAAIRMCNSIENSTLIYGVVDRMNWFQNTIDKLERKIKKLENQK